ncbi:MAG TPA: hypothetical protein ENK57_17685, partial [Polyangiaceae bacterium]|nr:hypothetical protein [Polyangiaceae bacterium]
MTEHLVLWHRWLPRRGRRGPRADAEIAAWRRTVRTRLEVAGARVFAAIGASVVAAWEPSEIPDAIELALGLLDDAEAQEINIALGAAMGPTTDVSGDLFGAVIERAQQLANRARGGELVLDASVRDAAREGFLFGRQVAGSWRGTTVDREHPRRQEIADAIALLAPASFPPIGESIVASCRMHLDADTSRTFILRGPVGAGATELVASLASQSAHTRRLSIGAAPGGVVPLASLRLSLLRRFGSPEELRKQMLHDGATELSAETIASVANGELVALDPLSLALAALFGPRNGARQWLELDPLSLVDGASLAAILEARTHSDFVIFGRLPTETVLPRPLASLDERVIEHVIPPLKTSDAHIVSEEILGPDTDPDVARRVAVLGGDTVIGVVEAARTLIATGELVRGEGDGFVWRAAPRGGANMISTEALISERLELLDVQTRRVLETVCIAPDGCARALLEAVAARDGIGPATFDGSLERLIREAFTRGEARPRPSSSLLRWRVLQLIPAARSMELHRFFGEALAARGGSSSARGPRLGELGYFLLEGGQANEAQPLLAAEIEHLVRAGYRRAARHLTGWMAQAAESSETAAGRATPAPPPAEAQDEGPPSSELALEELLDEITPEPARPAPPALDQPPPRELPPQEPPPPPAAALPPVRPAFESDPAEMLELSEDDLVLIEDKAEAVGDGALVLEFGEFEPDGPDADRRSTAEVTAAEATAAEVTAAEVAAAEVTASKPASEPPTSSVPGSSTPSEENTAARTRLEPPAATLVGDQAPAEPPEEDSDATLLFDAGQFMAAVLGSPEEQPADVPGPDAEAQAAAGKVDTADEPTDLSSDTTNVGPAPARTFRDEATAAIRARDFDKLERALQQRIAAGGDLGTVGRVRAVAHLAQGDVL